MIGLGLHKSNNSNTDRIGVFRSYGFGNNVRVMEVLLSKTSALRFEDMDKDKDLRSENKDKDKDLILEDKDKTRTCGPRTRTRHDTWAYAAMLLTSIESSFHPYKIYGDYPRGVPREGQNVQKMC